MADYGRMDPFSFAGSKDVDHPVSIRMYVLPSTYHDHGALTCVQNES